VIFGQDFFQQLLAFYQFQFRQVFSAKPKAIEADILDRQILGALIILYCLNGRETITEDNNLSAQARIDRQLEKLAISLGVCSAEGKTVTGIKACILVLQLGNSTISIPFDLKQPFGVVKRWFIA